jgi:antitoxin component YwqK of YwqJK toxin-antitoxin module
MKMINYLFILTIVVFLSSCSGKQTANKLRIIVDKDMLDSIKDHSDSMYIKPYHRSDLVTAIYYLSKKDSSITQVMQDANSTIRQIVIEKNKRRVYAAEYYDNGQLMYKYHFDAYGQYDGVSEEYYPSGIIKRQGIYRGGLHFGKWENFDVNGNYLSTDEYNMDGQQIKTYKE